MHEASLRAAITEAISKWCLENAGFPVAFIAAVDFVDSEGKGVLAVSEMDDQPTHRSLGLSTYLDSWYRDDALHSWSSLWVSGEESGD